jgi:hypothetical protein
MAAECRPRLALPEPSLEDSMDPKGVQLRHEELESFSPGFYFDAGGAQYFCASEFVVAHDLPVDMDFVRMVIADVMREFPGITVIEFAEERSLDGPDQ